MDLRDGRPASVMVLGLKAFDLEQTPVRWGKVGMIGCYRASGRVFDGNVPNRNAQLFFYQFHLLTHFLPIVAGKRGLRQVVPGSSEPFPQRLYILIESVRHGANLSRCSTSLRDSRPG